MANKPLCSLSHVQLFATPWTVTHQAPLSMKFSRQEYWSRLPFPTPNKHLGKKYLTFNFFLVCDVTVLITCNSLVIAMR